jgi:hypothetical protein
LINAPKLWNDEVSKAFKAGGLTKSTVEPCLFFVKSEEGFLLLVLTVDDSFVLSINADAEKNRLRNYLAQNYSIDFRGKLKWALGMEVITNEENSII